MKRVAIVGRADTHPQINDKMQEVEFDEIWGVGISYRDHEFELDRVMEIHPLDMLAYPNYNQRHWKWLHEEHPNTTVMMQERTPEMPASERFPIEAAEAVTKNLKVAGQSQVLLTSSFDYLMALAILKEYDYIYIAGFDMATGTEYAHQRAGAMGWIMRALALGIEVEIAEGSKLAPGKRYGYDAWDGAEGVTIEHIRELQEGIRNYKRETTGSIRKLDALTDDLEGEELKSVKKDITDLRRLMTISEGAFQALEIVSNEENLHEVVGRMTAEKRRVEYDNQRHSEMSELNYYLGKLNMLQAIATRFNGTFTQEQADYYEAEGKEAAQRVKNHTTAAFIATGAWQAMDWLVNDCDGVQQNYVLHNPINAFNVTTPQEGE